MTLNPYGYPCGAHTHATPDARLRCQGPPTLDVIPDLGVVGWVTAKRAPDEGRKP